MAKNHQHPKQSGKIDTHKKQDTHLLPGHFALYKFIKDTNWNDESAHF